MNEKEESEQLENAILLYNDKNKIDSILIKTIEECAELQQALSKFLLDQRFTQNIIDEIIDSSLMLNQLKISLLPIYRVNYDKQKLDKMHKWLSKHHLVYENDEIHMQNNPSYTVMCRNKAYCKTCGKEVIDGKHNCPGLFH